MFSLDPTKYERDDLRNTELNEDFANKVNNLAA
jgi:hypothetical protein